MSYGNKAADGGHLSLTEHEREELIAATQKAEHFIKKLTGSVEFINGKCCYRSHPFFHDEERLAYLFNLYEEMIQKEFK